MNLQNLKINEMKDVIFIPHKIEGEESLPKKKDLLVMAKNKTGRLVFISLSADGVKYILNEIDFWLEEVPVPTDEEIDEQSRKFTSHKIWLCGVFWLMGKFGLK